MNHPWMKILVLAVLLCSSAARGDELKTLRDLGAGAWNSFAQGQIDGGRHQFNDFLEKVSASTIALRDTQIEIMVGVLGCVMPEHRKMGHDVLDHVLQNGKGISEIRASLKSIRDDCGENQVVQAVPANTWKLVVASASSGAGVSGKSGSPAARPVASIAISHIDPAEFEKRLQETAAPSTALAPTLKRFGHAGVVTDHFIVVTENNDSERAPGVARCLDIYGANLSNEFNMVYPSHLITVYNAVWDEDNIYEIAGRLHGLQLSPGTIAYSVYADLSMTGAGDPQGCGSLAHELTHLMIKGNFGDAPPWLEEGLASAVALARAGTRIRFHAGWRDAVLRDKWSLRPSVAQLSKLTWDDFSASQGGDLNRAAVIQAMAAVFIRYLAVQNKLDDVYFAVRDQDLMTDLRTHATVQQILESKLGASLADIDKDFSTWFAKEEPAHATGQGNSSPATQRTCLPGERPSPMVQEMPCKPEVPNQASRPPR